MNLNPAFQGQHRTARACALCSLALMTLAPALCGQAPGEGVRWSVAEELRIGAVDGAGYDLSNPIQRVLPRDDGLLVISQHNPPELRLFTAEGRYVRTIGRAGEGPGDYRSINRVAWRADTLVVTDGALNRVTWLGSDGRVVRTARISDREAPDPDIGILLPEMLLHDGSVLAQAIPADGAAVGAGQEAPLLRVSPSGGVLDTIGYVPSSRGPAQLRLVSRGAVHMVPGLPSRRAGWTQRWTVADSGDLVVMVGGVGEQGPDSYSVRAIDPISGDLRFERTFRHEVSPGAVAAAAQAFEGWASRTVEMLVRSGVNRSEASRLVREALESPDLPEPARPLPVEGVRIGTDGRIWLRLHHEGGGQVWKVLDGRSGDPLGYLSLDRAYRFGAATEDRVWFVDAGSPVDPPQVIQYRLVPG